MQRDAPPLDPAPAAEDLQLAARAFFPDLTGIDPIEGHPDIARVTTPSRPWRIRRWPEGTRQTEIALSHEVMDQARRAGLSIVAEVATMPDDAERAGLHLNGRFYDAQQWLPGETPPRAEI